MTIKPIRNEAAYDEELREIDRLMGAASGTPESDKLEILVTLVERYESEHWAIEAPDPISTERSRWSRRCSTGTTRSKEVSARVETPDG